MRPFLILASISGALAVILGAFGAHILKNNISPELMEAYKTGVQYQFYHTEALLVLAFLLHYHPSKMLKYAGWLFSAGILLFSGSLYVLALTGIKKFGIVTPFGGLAFIAGWLCLLGYAWRLKASK